MADTEKITIIEGPPPTFEAANQDWLQSLGEGSLPYRTAVTRLRSFNGPALVERCFRAWRKHDPIFLEYRDAEGQVNTALILAARYLKVAEGQVLWLWVRTPLEAEAELDWGEDTGDAEGPASPDS